MPISNTKRKLIWELYGGRCVYCHTSVAFDEMTIDHIIPQSEFETEREANVVDNLCLCCRVCNINKGALSVSEFRTQTNTINGALLKLEAEKRKAERRIHQLTEEMDGKTYAYVRYLRTILMDKTLKGFGGVIAGNIKNK